MTTPSADAKQGIRDRVLLLLDELLPSPLPRPWPEERPLVDAGLDSVGVLSLVAELEARFGVSFGEEDLTEEHFSTLAGLIALLGERSGKEQDGKA